MGRRLIELYRVKPIRTFSSGLRCAALSTDRYTDRELGAGLSVDPRARNADHAEALRTQRRAGGAEGEECGSRRGAEDAEECRSREKRR
jgi:hypothetical protein